MIPYHFDDGKDLCDNCVLPKDVYNLFFSISYILLSVGFF